MGSQRISDMLKSLSGGLSVLAGAARQDEVLEGERNFQRERDDARNAFAERIQQLRMEHDDSQLASQQAFASGESEKDRAFKGEMFDKEQGARMKMFQMEQGAINARAQAGLAAEWARIKQAGAQLASAAEDRKLERQLKVYEVQVNQGQSKYNSVMESMQKEIENLSKNNMLMADSTGKKMDAARAKITEQYAPLLSEARADMTSAIDGYSKAVGLKADFSDVHGTPGLEGTEPAMRSDRITAAVEATKAKIGSGPMPPEANLIAGYMKIGMTRAEAMATARRVRSGGQ